MRNLKYKSDPCKWFANHAGAPACRSADLQGLCGVRGARWGIPVRCRMELIITDGAWREAERAIS
jgi:hypothetical protein